MADVLDDHVHADPLLRERGEYSPGDTRTVGHGDQRDLRDVAVVGDSPDLVALLHERVLLDQRPGRLLEGAEDLDDDIVDPAELHGPDLHDLGTLVGELQHLLVGDQRELPRVGDDARVRRVDPLDVRVDLATAGAQGRGKRNGGRVRAAPAEGRRLGELHRRRARALEAGHDDDTPGSHLGPDARRVDPRDPRPAIGAVRRDAGLGAGQADRCHAQRVERHGDERRALVLAGRQQHVQLARVGLLVDRGGQGKQLVRRVAHRGDDDAQVGAFGTGPGDPARDAADPVGVRHGRAAELHDDERV